MKYYVSFLLMHISLILVGQVTADFESYDLGPSGFVNNTIDSDTSGYFDLDNIRLPNMYNADYDFWTGWAISSTTDTLTPGFTNQYSAITGGGYDGSVQYAVGYASAPIKIHIQDPFEIVKGMYVTNSTYTYLSMRDGDAFAKKFGGATGDDPDFLKLTIRSWYEGEMSLDSVDFYLADFRSDNNTEDYIVDDWTYVDLSNMAFVDSLELSLTSSDVGQFGMNTPAYFCVDHIETDRLSITSDLAQLKGVELYPNPVQDQMEVRIDDDGGFDYRIYTTQGQLVVQGSSVFEYTQVDIRHLHKGSYVIRINNDVGVRTLPFIKL